MSWVTPLIIVSAVFSATTTLYVALYRKAVAETAALMFIDQEVDEEALEKLRRMFSEERKEDLADALKELKETMAQAEKLIQRRKGRNQ